jgi:uncharacterized membrane protein
MSRARVALAPDAYERLLAAAALLLLAALVAALLRGRAEWGQLPVAVWLHLCSIGAALALTPVLLLRRRGDRLHRTLGWTWAVLMGGAALVSFGIRFNTPGRLSWIHLLSVLTLVLVPTIVSAARTHRVGMHRRVARGTVAGALLLAGFFTFPFERLLGRWLFG